MLDEGWVERERRVGRGQLLWTNSPPHESVHGRSYTSGDVVRRSEGKIRPADLLKTCTLCARPSIPYVQVGRFESIVVLIGADYFCESSFTQSWCHAAGSS